jgi:hypothetical protein
MPGVERYELLVIGSGEAGKHLTWNIAQAGRRTAVVERKYIGGSCPNIACLLSKNVIRSAKANWFARSCPRIWHSSVPSIFCMITDPKLARVGLNRLRSHEPGFSSDQFHSGCLEASTL